MSHPKKLLNELRTIDKELQASIRRLWWHETIAKAALVLGSTLAGLGLGIWLCH